MGIEQERVTRAWLACYAAHDKAGLLDFCADNANYHVHAWHDPLVGREAIRGELDRQFDLVSDYRSTILNVSSTDAVVFIEGIDTFKHAKATGDVTVHWTSVQEINSDGRISKQRDYSDSAELTSHFGN